MKYFILLLLLSGSMYSQEQVFNVQRYCVDEIPFNIGECDISGNEYSFVFLDKKKNDVVFFFTNMKLRYKIMKAVVYVPDPNYTIYSLENTDGHAELKINKQNTKMEFLYPNNHIYLTVGKSTKL
ncbi:hypothetical protein [Flavobacterium sp. ACAM 123]|uniref:hypothetical protein n=1 Tax=Flavobacterium sp. ACAM 123 TaxID=1189620 RepID=UPI0003148EF3|nr:hypothetical protein [Flavobacterium sp. ACAM 123]